MDNDSNRPVFPPGKFTNVDWTDVYGEITEELPPDAPEVRGNPVDLTIFVDAAHAGDLVNRYFCKKKVNVLISTLL